MFNFYPMGDTSVSVVEFCGVIYWIIFEDGDSKVMYKHNNVTYSKESKSF